MTARSPRAGREVVERGTVHGVVVLALQDRTAFGTSLTSVLVKSTGRKPRWYSAKGERSDLLDHAIQGRLVRLNWLRYDRGHRLYLDGAVTHLAVEALGGSQRPRRAGLDG